MKRKELITLSQEEHYRLQVVRKIRKREIGQVRAADLLNTQTIRSTISSTRSGGQGNLPPWKTAAPEEEPVTRIIKDKK